LHVTKNGHGYETRVERQPTAGSCDGNRSFIVALTIAKLRFAGHAMATGNWIVSPPANQLT